MIGNHQAKPRILRRLKRVGKAYHVPALSGACCGSALFALLRQQQSSLLPGETKAVCSHGQGASLSTQTDRKWWTISKTFSMALFPQPPTAT